MIKRFFAFIFFVTTFFVYGEMLNFAYTNSSQENIPEWIYPRPFKYKANELPDPFVPFIKEIPKKTANQRKKSGPLTPLEKVSPTQLKLIGIMYSRETEPLALVELPDKKSYVLKKGTLVGENGGHVATVTKDRVIIIEPYFDVIEGKKVRKIELKLHPSEGEQK